METLTTSYQLLAESDYYTFLSAYSGKVCIRLYAKYNSQDIGGNSTAVSIKLTRNLTGTSSSVQYGCYQKDATLSGDLSHIYSDSTYATFNALSEYVIFEETFPVSHDDNGTKSLSLAASYDDSYISPLTIASTTFNLPTIPRQATITSASNFTDEENPTITYSNLAGEAVTELKAFIYAEDDATVLVDGQGLRTDATSFTFILTDEMRETLRKAAANSNSITVRPYVYTYLAGKEYWSGTTATMTIVNADPVLDVSVVDTNEATVALTGSPSKLVKFYSNAKATVSAEALKGATIDESKYVIGCGGVSVNATEHTFEEADYNVFTFSAMDSRGNVGEKEVEIDMIPYKKLTCIMSSNKPDAAGNMTVACRGAYFDGSFGAVDNTLQVQYRYAELSGVLGNWTDMTATITDGCYYATAELTGLDYQKTYTFECRAIDKLDTISSGTQNIKSIPAFHWGENDFVHETPVMFKGSVSGDGITTFVDGRIDEYLADYPIETGMEDMDGGYWFWRKWKSGRADCHGRRLFGDIDVTSAWGNIYSSASLNQDFPSGLFVAAPVFFDVKIINTQSGGAWVSQGYNNNLSASNTGDFCIYSPISEQILQAYLGFNAIGRWKI